jgi:hypothetical protein
MGVVVFIACSALVAARLLLVYKRLRQPPELFLGLAYLLAGTLGWGGLLVGALLAPKGQTVAEGLQAWSIVIDDAGTFCFYLFVWYMFRRSSLIAKAVLGLVAVVLVISIVHNTIIRGVTFGQPPGTVTTLLGMAARVAVFPWMAIEAFRSYAAFRRRARIGLGNPMVASRLLLWGISAVSCFGIAAIATYLFVTATDSVDATQRQNDADNIYGALAVVASVALWLAFFPLKAYQAWVEGSQKSEQGHG